MIHGHRWSEKPGRGASTNSVDGLLWGCVRRAVGDEGGRGMLQRDARATAVAQRVKANVSSTTPQRDPITAAAMAPADICAQTRAAHAISPDPSEM
eukprot:5265134-Prymnesium_polylepis.2